MSDFLNSTARVNLKSDLDEVYKGFRAISNTTFALSNQSLYQSIGFRIVSDAWRWRFRAHIEDKLSFTSAFTYNASSNFQIACYAHYLYSQMEFAKRNLMLSYWLNDNISLHFRNSVVPNYQGSENIMSVFLNKGNMKLISSLVSSPKQQAPYVMTAFKHKYSEDLTLKGRASSQGKLDLTAFIWLNPQTRFGITQTFSAAQVAAGKLDSGFGFSLKFDY